MEPTEKSPSGPVSLFMRATMRRRAEQAIADEADSRIPIRISSIAWANPATVLRLLDQLEAAESRIADLLRDLDERDIEKLRLIRAKPILPYCEGTCGICSCQS